jgi:hypothetical protein
MNDPLIKPRLKELLPLYPEASLCSGKALSSTSTSNTLAASFKLSYCDLSGLIEPEPLMLPTGALNEDLNIISDHEDTESGSRYGKFGTKAQPRQLSFDGGESELDSEISELFVRLLVEADRVTKETGCHIRFCKLTTSKSRPFKILLRHSRD